MFPKLAKLLYLDEVPTGVCLASIDLTSVSGTSRNATQDHRRRSLAMAALLARVASRSRRLANVLALRDCSSSSF